MLAEQQQVEVVMAPVRWSEVDRMVRPHQDSIVDEFLRFRGSPLLDEDGEATYLANGRQAVVTQGNFAEHFGIAETTFGRWLAVRGESATDIGARAPEVAPREMSAAVADNLRRVTFHHPPHKSATTPVEPVQAVERLFKEMYPNSRTVPVPADSPMTNGREVSVMAPRTVNHDAHNNEGRELIRKEAQNLGRLIGREAVRLYDLEVARGNVVEDAAALVIVAAQGSDYWPSDGSPRALFLERLYERLSDGDGRKDGEDR
jgi:hypothetical protein